MSMKVFKLAQQLSIKADLLTHVGGSGFKEIRN